MSTTPGSPEYLDGSSPGESAHAADHDPATDNRKRLIALGAVLAGGAVVAGGAWAATSFFATGACTCAPVDVHSRSIGSKSASFTK